MYSEFPDETALLDALLSGDDKRRKAAYSTLFNDRALENQTLGYVRRHGGNRADGQDIFQDALIVFDRRVRDGQYRGDGRLAAYFMGVVHWCWFNEKQRRLKRRTIPVEAAPDLPDPSDPGKTYFQKELRERLTTVIGLLSDKCRELIRLYMLEYKMEETAAAMGYAGSGVAKKESSLCRKKLRALLTAQAGLFEEIRKIVKP